MNVGIIPPPKNIVIKKIILKTFLPTNSFLDSGYAANNVTKTEITVNARVEYIEAYSGHADQEWLLNFVYSFIKKPKHIFLVHGEPNAQLILKGKLVESTQIPVTIPGYAESYTLDDNLAMEKKYQEKVDKQYLRLQVL